MNGRYTLSIQVCLFNPGLQYDLNSAVMQNISHFKAFVGYEFLSDIPSQLFRYLMTCAEN